MYRYVIDAEKPCIIIANKADKIAVTKVDSAVEKLREELNPLKDLTFLPYSSERRIYADEIWQHIEKML